MCLGQAFQKYILQPLTDIVISGKVAQLFNRYFLPQPSTVKKSCEHASTARELSGHLEEPYWIYIKRIEAPKHLYIATDPKYDCNLLYDSLIHKLKLEFV